MTNFHCLLWLTGYGMVMVWLWFIIGICRSQKTIDLHPLCSVCLWLWRSIREWQSLSHLEHVKAVVGLLARHAVFLWSLFSSAFNCCVSSYCDNPLLLCVQAFLSVAVTSQESVFMPSAWRSCLHTSLKRSWGHPVGLFPVASSPYKRSFGMRHLSSVSHVPAIASAFALRECISLVSQPFPAPL